MVASAVAALACVVGGAQGVKAASTSSCSSGATFGSIPVWARSGFSGSTKMHYVLGRGHSIVGLLFAYPLSSPTPAGMENKILWVSRQPDTSGANLHITAVRMIGARLIGTPVRWNVLHGPGPSIVDLPEAGCWRFTLSWAGKHDTLDLRYIA